jgi:hypothetical protein
MIGYNPGLALGSVCHGRLTLKNNMVVLHKIMGGVTHIIFEHLNTIARQQ